MLIKDTKAFTLVELIVVITILAILWTIAFISLQWYSANARDSVRISNITNMDKWLSIIQVKDWVLPDPEWNITTITSSWTILMTQWELTQTMAERLLKMSGNITDPVDSTNPIYSVTEDNKYFQVALFLEAGNLDSTSRVRMHSYPTGSVHAADWKTILTKWSELWIILTADETPVNQQSTHATTVELTTTTDYVAYLNENEKLEASWTELAEKIELAIAKTSSRSGSCKDILDRWEWTIDWEYTIYPNNNIANPIQVYCDMTTDWWGWTLVTIYWTSGRPIGLPGRVMPWGDSYWDISIVPSDLIDIKNWNLLWVENFSIDSKQLFENSLDREFLWYVWWITTDYITGKMPSSCNIFDKNVVCPENNWPFDVYDSSDALVTTTGYVCNSLPGDVYDEFGFHLIDWLDTSSKHCFWSASSLGHQQMWRLFTTFQNSNLGWSYQQYWEKWVHSHWNPSWAIRTPGYLMLR